MMRTHGLCAALLVLAGVTVLALAGCHTPYQCPILQPLTGGNIPAPLPPAPNDANDTGSGEPQRSYIGGVVTHPSRYGDAYKVIGYRDGIRFYIVQYNDKLYRGGDILSRKGAQALKDLGIKTIISVTPSGEERALAKEFGFNLVEIPFGTGGLTKEHLDAFLAAVEDNPGPIYVHSFGGDLQAAILLAYYRIRKEGWTYERTMNEYWRLDANYWDSLDLVRVLKENVAP